jgi:hypothetical protein
VTEKYELPLAVATAVGLTWLRSASASRQFGASNVAKVMVPSPLFSGAGHNQTTKVTRSPKAKLPCGRLTQGFSGHFAVIMNILVHSPSTCSKYVGERIFSKQNITIKY